MFKYKNDLIKELQGKIGNVNISIPINGENKVFKNIPSITIIKKNNSEVDTLSYPENDESVIENYNKYKKLSRYITEYIYWLYSKFIFEEKIKNNEILNPNNLTNFKNKYILIQDDFDYEKINKTFSSIICFVITIPDSSIKLNASFISILYMSVILFNKGKLNGCIGLVIILIFILFPL